MKFKPKHYILFTILILLPLLLIMTCVTGSDTQKEPVKTETKPVETKIEEIKPSKSPDEWVAPEGRTLVWSDEFEGPDINLDNWSFESEENGTWSHTFNGEWQRYTINETGSPNAYIEDGVLAIKAIKTKGGDGGFTSARMTTQGKHSWKYGHIAARIQMPYGKGMWPAFWMLGDNFSKVGWPRCGEIDIVEMIGGGFSDSKMHATIHWMDENKQHASNGRSKQFRKRLADDFHVYEMDWTNDYIDIKCDGFTAMKTKIDTPERAAFRQPFFIILNVAVGGGWPGPPLDVTVFPQYMYVDWVRVYQ
ncbi:MAG: glycoside hydrolase family 16 protein [Spirochaetales bacterium]|nr:glycoside hydrolase family 16 protein [Spirochaetales bacterium]